jgi:hypothetical protein
MEEKAGTVFAVLVCPACLGRFSASASSLTCTSCSRVFPVDDGIADFAEGRYFDDHPDPNALSEEARRGMANENEGGHWYGRLFRAPMAGFYALTALRGCAWLAGTALNPYLVLEVRRRQSRF